MGLNIVVTVKQVPDTQHVGEDAMLPDGTVNRSALPAIVNPEDLNALEEALRIKEHTGGTVTAISMGPPSAVQALKACLYRGADDVILITDRRFAGSDTLATSYVLKCAIDTLGDVDIVVSGRQAIDGDTAQVGPQLAEKLGMNQITYVLEILDISDSAVTAKRSIEDGYEIVESPLPVVMTVSAQANTPRPPSVKRVMAYKHIDSKVCELAYEDTYLEPEFCSEAGYIKEWNCESIQANPDRCGLSGSPTRVKKIENVVLAQGNLREIANSEGAVQQLLQELRDDHIID